jgi:aspartyl-tRNA(Asn)/glutamyl-tRNA(Gln) amidotransferase subunit B
MRVDANISLAGGDRAEVKNISSHKGVEKALQYEVTRQKNLKRRNIQVVQETRHYDEIRGITVSIRSKVGAHDYRYYPEADLVPIRVADWVPAIKAELPELPDKKRERFVAQYGVTDDHAKAMTSEIKVANFYEAVVSKAPPKLSAVWVADVLKGELNYRDLGIDRFSPGDMAEIINLLSENKITEDGAVEIIRTILDSGGSPSDVIKAKGLGKAEDDVVQKAVSEAIAECGAAVEDYKKGNERAMNFIVGKVMKKTRGRASPAEAHRLVAEALKKVA